VRDTVAVDTLARLATSRMSTASSFAADDWQRASIRYPGVTQREAGEFRGVSVTSQNQETRPDWRCGGSAPGW